MITREGAQRVLDYRVFIHNFGKFPEHIGVMQTKYEEFKIILTELSNFRLMTGHRYYFKSEFKKFDKWYGNYQQLWSENFAIL